MDLPFVNVLFVQTSTQRSAGPLPTAPSETAVYGPTPFHAIIVLKPHQRRPPKPQELAGGEGFVAAQLARVRECERRLLAALLQVLE